MATSNSAKRDRLLSQLLGSGKPTIFTAIRVGLLMKLQTCKGLRFEDLQWVNAKYLPTVVPPEGKCINTYLPMELLRDIFLYSIESNQIKSGQLASVCRYWRSVITTMSSLWSTLRVGTWTEREQVTTWSQRAYPKKVIIDTKGDTQGPSCTLPRIAFQNELPSSGLWH